MTETLFRKRHSRFSNNDGTHEIPVITTSLTSDLGSERSPIKFHETLFYSFKTGLIPVGPNDAVNLREREREEMRKHMNLEHTSAY